MNAKEAAALYVSKGWPVVPLTPRSKACKSDDWTTTVYRPDDFEEGDNIGIRSVGGLVVVDLDCDEAVKMADAFLPKTGAVWGRPSKLRSKRLHLCPELKKQLVHKDSESGKTVLEVRVNHQDMAPPSVHPDGELLSWDGEPGEAAKVDLEPLKRSARLLTTATLIARYYSNPGNRHEWTLALSGFLRKMSLTSEEAWLVVEQASKLAGDSDTKDRKAAVRGTYAKSEDDAVIGARRLEELWGKKHVDGIRKVWGDDDAAVPRGRMEELNKRHAVVFQQSGDLVVITEDEEDGKPLLRFSSLDVMAKLYPDPIPVGRSTKPLGLLWATSPRRRFYSGIEMAPNGSTNKGYYNMWRGFSVEPKKGSWALFRRHVEEVMADGIEDNGAYILSWMAETVQHPDKPIGVSPAFRGAQGTGKSTFATWFGRLFGPHFLHLDSEQQLVGRFNAHLHSAIVVFADEAVWAGDKAGIGALRRMITEEKLLIERKGIDAIAVKNMVHLIVASNEDWMVPAAMDERRFAVFDVSKKRKNDRGWFTAVHKELFVDGGMAAMLHDLLEWDLSKANLRDIPDTAALNDQKQRSMSLQHRWWHEELCDGDLWRERASDGWRLWKDELYERYLEALEKASRHSNRGTKAELGRFLGKVMPPGWPRHYQAKATGKRAWIIPELEDCRRRYESIYPGVKWPAGELVGDDSGPGRF